MIFGCSFVSEFFVCAELRLSAIVGSLNKMM